MAGRGPERQDRRGPPAAARPRRPGRHPEVRARDIRNILERASARETAARVAAGALARQFLAELGVTIRSHVTRIASVEAPAPHDLGPDDFDGVDESPVRCLDKAARRRWSRRSTGCGRRTRPSAAPSRSAPSASFPASAPTSPGRSASTAGSPRRWSRSSRSRASRSAPPGRSPPPRAPRPTTRSSMTTSAATGARRNRAGGLEGGMTNGEPLIVQVAIKPISTLTKPLRSVDIHTKEPQAAHKERTDSTVVPAAGVVGEAMLALTLARAYREKFGGDHIDDVSGRARRLPRAHRWALGATSVPERCRRPADDRADRLHGGRQDARRARPSRRRSASRRATPTS